MMKNIINLDKIDGKSRRNQYKGKKINQQTSSLTKKNMNFINKYVIKNQTEIDKKSYKQCLDEI